jgi:hypothetical protein
MDYTNLAMAKTPTKQPASQSKAPVRTVGKPPTDSWAIYHLKGTPAQFIGIVFDQPDQESAIKKAIEEYDIPANQHDRLIARRRD